MIVVWMATVAVVVFVALVVEIINQEHVVKVQLVYNLVSFNHQRYCSLHLLSGPFLLFCLNWDIVNI